MNEMLLREKLDELVGVLLADVQKEIGDSIQCLALTGSYATGSFSFSRPDVNFLIALKPIAQADVYLRMGEVLCRITHKYSDIFSVRPEFRPFKFPYPIYRKGLDVFINPIIVNMEQIGGDFPFGLPKNFLAGVRSMLKMVHGSNVLADLDLDVDKEYIIRACFRDLSIFKIQLTRAPMSYDLEKDLDLLLNESLSIGKMAMGFGVELASTSQELEEESYLDYFADKDKMLSFFSERFDGSAAKDAKLLLEARDNYPQWKHDKSKSYAVFKASYNILMAIWGKLMSIAHGAG